MIIVKQIGKSVHSATIVIYLSACSILLCVPLSLILERNDYSQLSDASVSSCLALLGVGFFGFAGQVLMNKSIQISNPGSVTQINYTQIFFAFLWGLVLHQSTNIFSIIGAVLISLTTISNMLYHAYKLLASTIVQTSTSPGLTSVNMVQLPATERVEVEDNLLAQSKEDEDDDNDDNLPAAK
jgi:hypothetical protein